MPITLAQTAAAMEVINSLLSATAPKGKRHLAAMFLELVDRTDWPQYYEVIPEPRCLNNIKSGVEKGRYKEASVIYTDLSLVFWNALYYNEPTSQISLDAKNLKDKLETEWKMRSLLPTPRISPPPSSAQKVHKVVEGATEKLPPTTTAAITPSIQPITAQSATSITRSTPGPVVTASGSSVEKPTAGRPKSSRLSPELELDVVSEDDQDGPSNAKERDQESEEIVQQLEKGLPRWPGYGEKGWVEAISHERIVEIVHVIKSHKDVIGNRLAASLEAVPEEPTLPYLSSTVSLSLKSIESRARAKNYKSSEEFDIEMICLFERGRRWHKPGTEPYGHVLLLQRLYQALVSANPPPGPPYSSNTNFAALRAGPGNVRPVYTTNGPGLAGVTHFRIFTKNKTFLDEVHYKGWTVKLGEWVHLSNADDPSRPIVAQVYKCWTSDEASKKGQPGLTAVWYYRPEQTFHSSDKMFWEGEVFETTHVADHPVEDIIEKVACQLTARHIHGRPRPPIWYLGFPLYICSSHYNDANRTFDKIKVWNSRAPQEVRQENAELTPIYPFERTVLPNKVPSPFIGRNIKGPGGLVTTDPVVEHQEADNQGDTPANGRNLRSRRTAGGDLGPNSSKGYARTSASPAAAMNFIPPVQYQPSNLSHQLQVQPQKPNGPDRSVIAAAGGLHALGQGAHAEKLPPETAKHFDRDPETNEVLWFPAPPVDIARPTKPKYSLAYLHFLASKRKHGALEHDAMNTDSDSASPTSKRNRTEVPPTVTETLLSVMREFSVET